MRELTTPTAQSGWTTVVNENFEAVAAGYEYNYATTTGLTLGYHAGHVSGTTTAAGTIALDASNTVYVVVHRTTGVVSKSTATTNWNATGTYGRLFKNTTSGSAITATEDWRYQAGGIFDHGATTGAIATDAIWDAKGDLAAGTGADAASKLTAGANDTMLMAASGETTGLKWATPTEVATAVQGTGGSSSSVGFRGLPVNSQSGNYTTALSDVGKSVRHPSGAGAGDTFTIDSQANVTWPDGAAITFENRDSNSLSIAITTDTLRWASDGSSGTRTLAQYGIATAVFDDAVNEWLISGTGLG